MFLSSLSSLCKHPKTLLTQYVERFLTDFHQTYTNDAFRDRDEFCRFWDQRVKGQGHRGIKYAGKSIIGLVNVNTISRTVLDCTIDFLPTRHYGKKMNTSDFGVKKS